MQITKINKFEIHYGSGLSHVTSKVKTYAPTRHFCKILKKCGRTTSRNHDFWTSKVAIVLNRKLPHYLINYR